MSSQTTDVTTGIIHVNSLLLNRNNLYFSGYFEVSKIDITDTNPTVTDVIIKLQGPSTIAFKGNDLYFGEFRADKISKINITDTIPTPTDVITGLDKPSNLVFNGNDLYVTSYLENDGKIVKIDVAATNPVALRVS